MLLCYIVVVITTSCSDSALESVLKDLDFINRYLHSILMNSCLLKCFWFLDVFVIFDIAIYCNLTFHCCIMMRSVIKQIITCNAKLNCLHSSE